VPRRHRLYRENRALVILDQDIGGEAVACIGAGQDGSPRSRSSVMST
jgi:hypothetical protein